MRKEEQHLRKMGFQQIAGTDEAGRGPLAGPVVAAAVIFHEKYTNRLIKDSKQLTTLEREILAEEIKAKAVTFSLGVVNWKEIDALGILNASKLAMRRAVLSLNPLPDFLISDAVAVNIMGIPQKAIVKADQNVFCVAAASILAKVHRDQLMAEYHKKYPQYGFNEHMGYATEVHLKAIEKHGPCQIHRKSFSPFKISVKSIKLDSFSIESVET